MRASVKEELRISTLDTGVHLLIETIWNSEFAYGSLALNQPSIREGLATANFLVLALN